MSSRSLPARVALIGLGAMGARMGQRLLDAGHPLVVYNRTPARADALVAAGATRAETPRAAAEAAEVVIAMVTDDEASRAVWDDPQTGALLGLRAGAIAVESSTVTPARVAALDEAVRARDAALIDAPVAGSRPQAEAGILVHLVGGPSEAVERMRPVLATMSKAAVHAGPIGAGAALKLTVNTLFAVQVAAFAEAVEVLSRLGFDRGAAIKRLAGLPITSPAVAGVAPLIAAGDDAPRFPIALVAKDLRYARVTADSAGARAPMASAAAALYQTAVDGGLGGVNITGIARHFSPPA